MASTVLTSWALLVWEELQAEGLDSRAIFKQAGLNPDRLGDGNARYKVSCMQALWRIAQQASDNPGFGVDVGMRWSPTTFHALGFSWLASASLGDAMRRFGRYSRIINDGFDARLEVVGPYYKFSFTPDRQEKFTVMEPAGLEASITALIKMCRMLVGEQFSPVEVGVFCKRGSGSLLLENYVRSPVKYQSDSLYILVNKSEVDRALPAANSALVQANDEVALDYLSHMDKNFLSAQVKARIIEQMASGIFDEASIAQALNITSRTLQRKLKEEGNSYRKILKTTRQEMLENYISDSRLSISEIAYLLGFSDQANFTRAFRNWYGCSPTDYRLKQQKISA